MRKETSTYRDVLELLDALKLRRTIHNALNSVIHSSEDRQLVGLIRALLHEFTFTSANPLHIPLQQMTACEDVANKVRLHCERKLRAEIEGSPR